MLELGELVKLVLEPWLAPVVVAIVVAFVSAHFTLRGNIRQRAWLIVYQDKRSEIRRFLHLADEFASNVLHIGEVIDIMGRPPLDKFIALQFQARRIWGPDPSIASDPVGRQLMSVLPNPQQVIAATPAALNALQDAARMLLNVLEEEIQHLNLKMGELKTTLALSIHNPENLTRAQGLVTQTYEELHAAPAFQNFDYEAFADRWSQRITEVKLAFRKDLTRSSRGLGPVLRLSWWWRVKRHRIWKGLGQMGRGLLSKMGLRGYN